MHRAMLEVLENELMRKEYDPTALDNSSTKIIYTSRADDVISSPKVEAKYPGVDFVTLVYPANWDRSGQE